MMIIIVSSMLSMFMIFVTIMMMLSWMFLYCFAITMLLGFFNIFVKILVEQTVNNNDATEKHLSVRDSDIIIAVTYDPGDIVRITLELSLLEAGSDAVPQGIDTPDNEDDEIR